jgi:uncharacterized protein (DUF4415 family)
MIENELADIIVAYDNECRLSPDWTKAELVLPESKPSVNLCFDHEIVEFFKGQGRGHISRMQPS